MIAQDDVDQLIRLGARIAKLQAKYDVLSEEIKEKLISGERCPKRGPYILSVQEKDCPKYSPKDLLAALLKWIPSSLHTSAVKFINKKKAIRKTVYALEKKPNPRWSE